MKKLISTTFILLILSQIKLTAQTNTFPTSGSAGIGTTTPVSSAIMEMQSTSQGMLAPRMTKAQRDAIASPVTGLLIFQTNAQPGFYYFNGSGWTPIASKGANTTLSNLGATTSINSNLLPNANNTLDLGSPVLNWNEIYVNAIKFMDGTTQSTAGGGAAYIAGTGISIAGSVISNTGDTNAADDLTILTNHGGDVTGVYSNLQIGSGAVGSTEIADGSVSSTDITDGTISSTDILNGTIAAADLNSMGASTGQVMQWNGTAWVATTPAAGAETDPQVGTITTNLIPRWDGTALISGAIADDGDNISVGWNSGINSNASAAFYNNEGAFVEEDIALKAVDQTVSLGGTATVLSYANLGYNTTGLVFIDAPVSHVGVWGNASATSNSAAVYANTTSTGTSNYGVVAKSAGAGTTNYGIWAKASGASTNYAGYFDGDVEVNGTDQTLTVSGTNPYIQMANAGSDIGYIRANGSDMMVATNSGVTGKLILRANGINSMYIDQNGSIVMGSTAIIPKSGYKLSVDGKVVCEELLVQLSPWPDYVFNADYKLKPLSEVESFIQTNNHLPGMPNAKEVETEGLNVGEMQKLMMEKIEELTLYMIELQKENAALNTELDTLHNYLLTITK